MLSLSFHSAIVVVLVAASTSAAQESKPTSPSPPAVAATPEAMAARAPLVREGSFVVQVRGDVERDSTAQQWIFVPHPVADEPKRDFILLPSQGLDDIVRVAEDPRQGASFEITGEIFVYAGRNYLLPLLASPLIDRIEQPKKSEGSTESSEIERSLEARVGRASRSAGPQAEGGAPAAGPASQGVSEVDGRIASRRGVVVRNGTTGGWRFVFDADASGRRDPDMDLLPCLALERIERLARQSDGPLVLEMSGRTFTSRGRTYLLSTRFIVPTHSTPIRRPTPAGAKER